MSTSDYQQFTSSWSDPVKPSAPAPHSLQPGQVSNSSNDSFVVPGYSSSASSASSAAAASSNSFASMIPNAPDPDAAWHAYCDMAEVRQEIREDLFSIFRSGPNGGMDTQVVLLLDDSGSMNTKVNPVSSNGGRMNSALAFGQQLLTRWQELIGDVQGILQLVNAASPHRGVDVRFMNRAGRANVTDISQLMPSFNDPPRGGTPMIGSLQAVFRQYSGFKGRVLVILVTDGEPSDGDYDYLKRVLLQMPANFYISFVECNDNEEEMNYLSGWDYEIPRFHNQEDYGEELNLVRRVQGPNAKFTRANYVQMIVLSPIFPKYAIDMRTAAGRWNPFSNNNSGRSGFNFGNNWNGNNNGYYNYNNGRSYNDDCCCTVM